MMPQGPEIATCQAAIVNWEGVEAKADIVLPNEVLLNFVTTLDNYKHLNLVTEEAGRRTLLYKNLEGSMAMLSIDQEQGTMYGMVKMAEGDEYIVETMEDRNHVAWAR